MQLQNLTNRDITFMYTDEKRSTSKMPVFDTVNIVAGWTVLIPEDIWKQLCKQTTSVHEFEEEVVPIQGAGMKDADGKAYVPTKTIRQWTGKTKEVNLIKHLIDTRSLAIIKSEEAPALPERSVMVSFLSRFGEVVKEDEALDSVIARVRKLKEELAAIETV